MTGESKELVTNDISGERLSTSSRPSSVTAEDEEVEEELEVEMVEEALKLSVSSSSEHSEDDVLSGEDGLEEEDEGEVDRGGTSESAALLCLFRVEGWSLGMSSSSVSSLRLTPGIIRGTSCLLDVIDFRVGQDLRRCGFQWI